MDPIVVDRANQPGWIEVVCGSMFSGKTEELIRRLNRARIARQHVEIFKPAIDARFSETDVVSHDENVIVSTPVDSAHQIILLSGAAQVIGIDEAQFFGTELVEVCRQLAVSGKRVIVAGLDQDFLGNPFEPIPQLMAIAEYVTKLHAICVVCGSPANHSQRLVADSGLVVVGAAESYEPRCRRCFDPELATKRDEDASRLSASEVANDESMPHTVKKSTSSEPDGPPVRPVRESTGMEGEEMIPGWTQLNTAASPQAPQGQATTEGDGLASDAVDLSGGLPS